MTSPAPACASDASLDENRIPFFFGPASLLIPFLIFALLSVYLFVVLKVFDLMALAGAGLTPFSLMTATFYPIALFVVFSVSIATGIGRPKMSDEPQATDKA